VDNRGQITVFIIIAIFLLIGVGIYLYLQREAVIREEYIVPVIKEPAEAAKPVANFVQLCLKDTARQALSLIGDQGGYIDVSDLSYNSVNPTKGSAVQFVPGSGLIIPYWSYMDADNDCDNTNTCTFAAVRPNLYKTQGPGSIEEQIDLFINENIETCFQDFRAFREQGIAIRVIGEAEADTRVTENDVFFYLKLPLEVDKAGITYTVDEYFYQEPLQLKEIYDVAIEISNNQMSQGFIEKHVLNLIAINSGVGQPLPPIQEMEFKMGMGRMWIKSEVKKDLRDNILAPYIQLLRVANVAMTDRIAVEDMDFPQMMDSIFNWGMITSLAEPHPGMGATFTYLPFWEPYFNLNCRGELCTSESLNMMFLLFFGIQKYSFSYDLSFPVLVQIFIPDAFEGSGYTFKYFLEANIRNNRVLSLVEELPAPLDLRGFGDTTMLCDIEQRTSGAITVNVSSGLTFGPGAGKTIGDASIVYFCGDEQCTIGVTKNGVYTGQFPRCANGILAVDHSDYTRTSFGFSILDDTDKYVEVVLEPYRLVNISLMKRPVRKTAAGFEYQPSFQEILRHKEEAIITLNRKKQSIYDEALTAFANIVGNELTRFTPCPGDPAHPEPRTDISKNIRILPGEYVVNVNLFSYEDIKIPAEKREIGSWPFEEDVPFPEVQFNCTNPFPMGNVEFEIELDASELDRNNELILFAPAFDLQSIPENQRHIEDLSGIEAVDNVPTTHPSSLRPRLE